MTDRRLTPANGRVAARDLQGLIKADRYVDGEKKSVCAKSANLWADCERKSLDRQLIYGDYFLVLETTAGMAFGQSLKDGYVGYVTDTDLADSVTTTHSVCVRLAHVYPRPDIKSVPIQTLSFGSSFRVTGEQGDFLEIGSGGFVFRDHVRDLKSPMPDPAAVAQLFLGTPYLWGGNSCDGIDCSGLVQAALLSCDQECPGDSDLQQTNVGEVVGDNVPVERGDLFFWNGHVAMAVNNTSLIHATAHGMAVVIEDIELVKSRIIEQGSGPVLVRKRP